MKSRPSVRVLLAPLAAVLLSCSGDSPTDSRPVAAQIQAYSGDKQIGNAGSALPSQLAVKVMDAGGISLPGVSVAWVASAGGGSLSPATSTTDASGVARTEWTLGPAGSQAASASVTGLPPVSFGATGIVPVASIALSSTAAGMKQGETLQLTATPLDPSGNPLPGRQVSWATTMPHIASVSDSGRVTGLGPGTASIIATSEGQTARATVSVSTIPDAAPPTLTGLSFSPASVDVTTAAAGVELTVSATDDVSGVRFVTVSLSDRDGTGGGYCFAPRPASGTVTNGVWKCSVSVPKGTEAGTWSVSSVTLEDSTARNVRYSGAELRAAGYPTTLAVANSGPPAAPPVLTGLSFSPSSVDVGTSGATVEVVFSATSGAGIKEAVVYLTATRGEPGGAQTAHCTARTLASGSVTDGTWKCSLTIPKSAAAGTWVVQYASLLDAAGKGGGFGTGGLASAGFPTTLRVESANEDVTRPVLATYSISPATVNLSGGGQWVDVVVEASDAGTGIYRVSSALKGPGGESGGGCASYEPSAGTQRSGTFRCRFYLPGGTVAGTWLIENMVVQDNVGNYVWYTLEQLRAAGLPVEVTVTR